MKDQIDSNDVKTQLDGGGSKTIKREGKKRRGKKKGKEAERKVKCSKTSDRYNEEDADIIIISSDGTAFKAHSFLLLRASSVFKNMVDIAKSDKQRDPIILTDPHVELEVVVEATLDILYDHDIPFIDQETLYHHVIDFARKWDMSIILSKLSKQLRLHAISDELGGRPLRLLRLAINLGDNQVIATIIKSSARHGKRESGSGTGGLPWKSPTLRNPIITGVCEDFLKGAPIFELGSWPYSTFAALPLPLAWAILRAGANLDLTHVSRRSITLATEVQKLMDIMYPNQAAKPGEKAALSS